MNIIKGTGLSIAENRRAVLCGYIERRAMTVKAAGEALDVSYRQMKRIWVRYHEEGVESLAHRGRGRSSCRRIAVEVRRAMVARYREYYHDCGVTYAFECLQAEGYRGVSRETFRRWLHEEGLITRVRKHRTHRRMRVRAEHRGALVQVDGSLHRWFERRGAACWLMAAIDDATSEIYAVFDEYEGTEPAMRLVWGWVARNGIPLTLYCDRKNWYVAQPAQSVAEQVAGTLHHTDFTRACADMGIRVKNAHSPQAKGRVERLFRTLQDRLVKDMRYAGVSGIAAANRYLCDVWLPRYNRGQMERQIRPGQRVELRAWLDGSVHIYANGHEVRWVEVGERTAATTARGQVA